MALPFFSSPLRGISPGTEWPLFNEKAHPARGFEGGRPHIVFFEALNTDFDVVRADEPERQRHGLVVSDRY
jgi:hypothetical protein